MFDGDGMIHSTRFASDGSTALYQNKWVQTKAMDFEAQANYSFSVIGEMDALEQTGNMNWIPHVSNPDNIGRANTALVFHPPTKKLLALFEVDYPYQVDIDTLSTVARVETFGGDALKFSTFTAHPKVCPQTNDLVFFDTLTAVLRMDRSATTAWSTRVDVSSRIFLSLFRTL